jgi:hypothetical protein
MADTRILPKSQPRSTGIPRVATQTSKTPQGGTSSVTTAPGVGREIHDYVHSRGQQQPARSRMDQSNQFPGAIQGNRQVAAPIQVQAQGQAQVQTQDEAPAPAPAIRATQVFPAAPTAARPVQRIVSGGGQSSVTQRPAVQLIDRSKPGLGQAASAPPPFTIDQLMLIAHLLEHFAEGEAAVAAMPGAGTSSKVNVGIANGALSVVGKLMNSTYSPSGAQADAIQEPILATSEAPAVTIVAAPSATAKAADPTPTTQAQASAPSSTVGATQAT